jgi:hypothetical protein
MSLAVLPVLDMADEKQATAASIGHALGWSHEETYAALVALESRGAVRVVVDFTDQRKCSGVARWELMPAGVRMMFSQPQDELEPA